MTHLPTTPYPRFHLAFPVTDLDEARRFYADFLGCGEGRSAEDWVDFDFFGHQIVAHKVGAAGMSDATSLVDGKRVPVRLARQDSGADRGIAPAQLAILNPEVPDTVILNVVKEVLT